MTGGRRSGRAAALLAGLLGAVLLLEGLSFLALRLTAPTPIAALAALPVYRDEPWAPTYWREAAAAVQFPARAVSRASLWRFLPYPGQTLSVDEEGLRRTRHSRCGTPGVPTVAMFGSSMLWGFGAPDDSTIPSLVAERFERDGRPVCVRNYGQWGWTSAQGLLELTLELRRPERRPDLVVFYDGSFDVKAGLGVASPEGEASGSPRATAGADRPGLGYLLESNTARLVRRIAMRRAPADPSDPMARPLPAADAARLADAVVAQYLATLDAVDVLAAHYRFTAVFLWHPYIVPESKPLAPAETAIRDGLRRRFPAFDALLRETYPRIRAVRRPRLHSVADVFAEHPGPVYIDAGHLTPEGNEVVARRVYDILRAEPLGGPRG